MEVILSTVANEQLGKIQNPYRRQIYQKLKLLEANGLALNSVKALTGKYAGAYRIRSGEFRIVFFVLDDVAHVIQIEKRGDVYRP